MLGAFAGFAYLFSNGLAAPVSDSVISSNASLSIQDKIVLHLQDKKIIQWKPAGKGLYADIPDDAFDKAVTAVGETRASANLDKRGTPNDGAIGGYSVTKQVCYGSGSISEDSVVAQYAFDACDGLIGATVPALPLKVLRIWQSAQQPDLAGQASYIRYGIRLLADNTITTPSLCQSAFQAFNNYCQKKGAAAETQGGELDISKLVRFSVDPNEVSSNA